MDFWWIYGRFKRGTSALSNCVIVILGRFTKSDVLIDLNPTLNRTLKIDQKNEEKDFYEGVASLLGSDLENQT